MSESLINALSGFAQNAWIAILIVLFFGITIFVHELGHFLVAKRMGMVIETFALGFGPALWKRKINGITYKIGLIPVGGYVSLPQIDPSGMSTIQGDTEKNPAKLPPVSPWRRIPVLFCGSLGNAIFAVALAWFIYWGPESVTFEENNAMVGSVDTNSVAYERGLRNGDGILEVNGKKVSSWYTFSIECLLAPGKDNAEATLLVASGESAPREIRVPLTVTKDNIQVVDGVGRAGPCIVAEITPGGSADEAGMQPLDVIKTFDGIRIASVAHMQDLVALKSGVTVPVTIEREGLAMKLNVTPRFDPEQDRARIGVMLVSEIVTPWMQESDPWRQLESDSTAIVRVLQALVTPSEARKAAQGLGGPVMIFATLFLAIKISFMNAIGFLRFLNINLAILNLLPIPVLDGGHIMFTLWEGITGRKVSPRVVNALVNTFAVLLIGVMILLTFKDAKFVKDRWPAFSQKAAQSEQVTPEAADKEAEPVSPAP